MKIIFWDRALILVIPFVLMLVFSITQKCCGDMFVFILATAVLPLGALNTEEEYR